MKVVLLQDVEKIGKAGDIEEVSAGYARNFLFAKNLAKPATPEIIEEFKHRKEKEAKMAELDLVKTEEIAQKIEGLEIEVSEKSSEEGTLFGSITAARISSLLTEKGFDIKKEQVAVDHIKEVGEHEVVINLPHGLEVKIVLIVNAVNEIEEQE